MENLVNVFFPFGNLGFHSVALAHFFLASANTMKQKKRRIKGKRIKRQKGKREPSHSQERSRRGERRRKSFHLGNPLSGRNLGREEVRGIRKPRPAGNSKCKELAARPSRYSSRPPEIPWTGAARGWFKDGLIVGRWGNWVC